MIILSTATVPVCRILNALHNLLLSPKLSSFSAAELLLASLEPGTQNSAPENCSKIHFPPDFCTVKHRPLIHTEMHESDERLSYIASSTAIRPKQYDKCFNIHLFLTYATCFGRKFQTYQAILQQYERLNWGRGLSFTLLLNLKQLYCIIIQEKNNKIFK
jgi:hypothetical protein